MQKSWSDLDHYIESHLIPEDIKLQQAIDNTDQHGLSNHLAVAPNQGMLLQMLIQMNNVQRVLEIGTFAAYSTLWLARALPKNGYLLTIEGRDSHAAVALENIKNAQMGVNIDLQVGMATDILKALPQDTPPFDFIFIDADKASYPIYLELALQFSQSGSVIVFDNVIRAGDIINPNNNKPSITGIREMFTALKAHPKLMSCTALQTVGSKGHDGLAIAIVK